MVFLIDPEADFPTQGPGGLLNTPKHTKRFSGKPAIIANILADNNPGPIPHAFCRLAATVWIRF